MTHHISDEHEDTATKFLAMLKDFDTGMLMTRMSSNDLRARPMSIARRDDDGTLYFLAARNSAKSAEIRNDPHVCVAFQKTNESLSLSGRASIVDDRGLVRSLWSKMVELWFPDGPEDPNVIAIKVEPDAGEYWNDRGANLVKFALRSVIALSKGERVQHDRNEHGAAKL